MIGKNRTGEGGGGVSVTHTLPCLSAWDGDDDYARLVFLNTTVLLSVSINTATNGSPYTSSISFRVQLKMLRPD